MSNNEKWVFLCNFVNLNAIEVKLGSNERYWDGLYYYWVVACKWAHLHISNLHICSYFVHFYSSGGKTTCLIDVSSNILICLYHIIWGTSHGCYRKSFQLLSSCRFEDIPLFPWKLISCSTLKTVFPSNFVNLNATDVKLGSNGRYCYGLYYYWILVFKWAHLHIPNLHICSYFVHFCNFGGKTTHANDVMATFW